MSGWEAERSRLHHDDYHYRFYHYLGRSGGETEETFVKDIAIVLAGTSGSLPEAAGKAFKHWPRISNSLRDLLKRAPREAPTDPNAVLARMATAEIGKGRYPALVAAIVHERAERVLQESAARFGQPVEMAIEEPRRLVEKMDEFVALFDTGVGHPHLGPLPEGEGMNNKALGPREGERTPADEAERRVREFLENCRRLDRALSDIPRRLRGENGT